MTTNGMSTPRPDNFDLFMADWLDRSAVRHAPEGLLDASLARTARRRPLPAWRLLERWIPVTAIAMRRPVVPRPALILAVIGLLVIALVAALLVGIGTPKLPPLIGPAGNGRIAYISEAQAWTSNADGSGALQLTTDSLPKTSLVYSNDGRMLAFRRATAESPTDDPWRSSDLVVMNADGSNARVLVRGAISEPDWSPDSKSLAYSMHVDATDTDHAFVSAVDGSGVTDLGDLGGQVGGAWTPSWSPDGTKLAISRGDGTLWIINRDGTGAYQLNQLGYVELGSHGETADWSPDGKHLLFAAGDPGQGYGLYLASLDGSKEIQVTPRGDGGTWSPDGTRFVYMTMTNIGVKVYVVAGDLSSSHPLPGLYGWFQPVWSPDGTRVAVRDSTPGDANVDGVPVTVILDPDGVAEPVVIPTTGGIDTEELKPGWSVSWQRMALP